MEGTIVVSPGLPEVAPKADVRLGWYLEDARHFLRKEGTYVAWIEQTCPLSYGHTTRLRQLSKHFCRDSIDDLQRLKLGISIPGLLENRGAFAPANRSIAMWVNG